MSLITTATAGRADLASTPVTVVPLTIAAWFKCSTLGTGVTLVTVGTSGTLNHHYALSKSAADLVRSEEMDGTTSSASPTTLAVTDTNVWHLGIATFVDNTSRPAYFDGQYKSSATAARTTSGVNAIRIGQTLSAASMFPGLIATVGIWNVALDDGDAQKLYNRNPFGSVRANNLAFWVPRMNGSVIDVVGGNSLAVTSVNYSGDEPVINYPRTRYFWGIDAGISGTTATGQGGQTIAATGTETLTGTITTGQGSQTTADVGTETETGTGSTGQGGQTVDAIGTSVAAPAATETFSGGYETAYERHLYRRRREREREEQIAHEAQEAAKDDPLQAELARYLHDQIAKQAKHDDLLRMQKIVQKQALDRTLPDKVQKAFVNAQAEASFSRLMALEREFIKMQEEEELALLMTLSLL